MEELCNASLASSQKAAAKEGHRKIVHCKPVEAFVDMLHQIRVYMCLTPNVGSAATVEDNKQEPQLAYLSLPKKDIWPLPGYRDQLVAADSVEVGDGCLVVQIGSHCSWDQRTNYSGDCSFD